MEFAVTVEPTTDVDIYMLRMTGEMHHFSVLISKISCIEQLSSGCDRLVFEPHGGSTYVALDLVKNHLIIKTPFTETCVVLSNRSIRLTATQLQTMITISN